MMKQEALFRKLGNILNELNDQYQFLSQNPEQLSELELELFLANANFLADHIQIIKKLNLPFQSPLALTSPQIQEEPAIDEEITDELKDVQQVEAITFANVEEKVEPLFQAAPIEIKEQAPIVVEEKEEEIAQVVEEVVVEYEIVNTSNADLENIYTGLFTDWDLDESSANATEYDGPNKTAYVYAKKNATYPYAGIRLLNHSAAPAYYPLSYQLPNSFLSDNVFNTSEKYKTLTSGIQAAGLGHNTANGYDVMFTVGSGPYKIPKNQSIRLAYAFLAGDHKSELTTIGDAAQVKYTEVSKKPVSVVPSEYALGQNYPNQGKAFTYIPVDVPERTKVDLTIYDVMGRKIKKVTEGTVEAGSYQFYVDLSTFASGVYTYKLNTPNYKQAKKMIVAK